MDPKLLIALMFALLLLGCTGTPIDEASQSESEIELESSWLEENWIATALVIVFATFLFLGITYMISESFNSKELRAWTIAEFFQAGMSIIIIVILVMFFSTLSQFTQTLADPLTAEPCTTGDCHIVLSQTYLSNVRNVAIELASYTAHRSVSAISKSTFRISLVAVDLIPFMFSGFSVRPFAGFSIYSDRYILLTDNALRMAASLNAQILFLEYIRVGLVPLLLIAGVLLRSVFFLRRVGGLLIAIAIALFTVYPLMYLLFQYTYTSEWLPPSSLPNNVDVGNLAVKTTEIEGTMITYCDEPGADSETCCDRNALSSEYPAAIATACAELCLNPNPAAPQFAQDACNTECDRACEPDDSDCYARCATISSNAYFLCSSPSLSDCNIYAIDDGGNTDAYKYKDRALEYLGTTYPEIGSCKDLVVLTADPYAMECSGCLSTREADCRITYKDYDTGLLANYEDEVLPGLPMACKQSQEIVDACIACETSPPQAHALTKLPDPEMQKRCAMTDVLGSGIIPTVDSDDFGSQGDIEAMGVLVVPGIVLPIFNFIITITFIKIFSPALGGDIDIEGLTRLV